MLVLLLCQATTALGGCLVVAAGAALANGKNVMVHCLAGAHRAGTTGAVWVGWVGWVWDDR